MSDIKNFTNDDNDNFDKIETLSSLSLSIMELIALIREHTETKISIIELSGISMSGIDEVLKGDSSETLVYFLKKLELLQIASLRIIAGEFDKLYNEPKFIMIKNNEEFISEFGDVIIAICEQMTNEETVEYEEEYEIEDE